MNSNERRLQLFQIYSTNWRLIRSSYRWAKGLPPEFEEMVICPLCLTPRTKKHLNQSVDNPLTLEHIPPSNLGGKPKILMCKKCNNDSGRRLDHNISHHLQTQPFFSLQDGAKIKVPRTEVETDKGKLSGSATLTYFKKDNTLQFDLNINKNESTRNEQFRNLANSTKWGGKFTINAPSPKFVYIALLRIGYLILFNRFGNAFILNKRYNDIRQQILNPEEEILPLTGVLETKNQLPLGIYMINRPREIEGFYVSYSVRYEGREYCYGVFLPSPLGRNALEYYTALKAYKGKTINFNYNEFRDLDYLTNQEHAFSCIKAFQFSQ